MTQEERLVALMSQLPDSCRDAVGPVLRAVIHELSGALSAVTMEAFCIEQLANSLGSAEAIRSGGDEPLRQLENLQDGAQNLARAAADAAKFLARLEQLTDESSP